MRKLISVIFLCLVAFGLVVHEAQAKRLGGGVSRGMQRDPGGQRQQSAPQAPFGQQTAPQSPSGSQQPAPARRSWLGPLAGLAAGIGIGALLAHFGLSEGLADLLVIVLLAGAAIFVFKLLFRRRAARPNPEDTLPLQYAGIGGPHLTPLPSDRTEAADGKAAAPAPTRPAPTMRNIPPGFDGDAFLRVAQANFVRLQAANDAGNLDEIREFTTPDLFAEFKSDIDKRHGAPQRTDVVTLAAELLEVVEEGGGHIASVRFHGMIREETEGAAQPFDEVWHLVQPGDGSHGWVLAGIQPLN